MDGVSFEVKASSVVAVLGANGAGKSTLLNCVAGVLRPDSGNIELGGAKVGYMGHKSFLYDDLSAKANLKFWSAMAGVDNGADKAEQLFEAADLGRHSDKKVRAMSAGMVKKVSLCRAVINEPEVLVLDEPFSAMDEAGRDFAISVINGVREKGGIVLLTSHDLESAVRLASDVLVLDKARVYKFERADKIDIGELHKVAGGVRC